MRKITKNLIGAIIIFVIIIIALLTLKYSTIENSWFCKNGQWIKHGKPATSVPTTGCGISTIITSTLITTSTIEKNKMIISVSFPNKIFDPNMIDCSKVFTTERSIIKTPAVGRAALEELFKGPTELEKKAGYFTTIPDGVKIQKLSIVDGVARVDLSKELEYQVGGSCRIGSIIAEITETLKQFSTVQKVIISVDGRTEDILQP
ncbi:MAG: GerMN domain-containing protein [Candidatus Magasanikiibacteriota bacterium]